MADERMIKTGHKMVKMTKKQEMKNNIEIANGWSEALGGKSATSTGDEEKKERNDREEK